MKTCKKCNISKESSEFHKSNSKDGLSPWCKACKNVYDKEYRQTEKVQSAYKSKSYRDRKKEYQSRKSRLDPRKKMLILAKCRAKKLGLDFNLEIEDIVIPELCPLLDIPIYVKPYNDGKRGFHANSPSLDKIVPEKGYIKGNVMVISMKANAMKYNASLEELLIFAKNINKLYGTTDVDLHSTDGT